MDPRGFLLDMISLMKYWLLLDQIKKATSFMLAFQDMIPSKQNHIMLSACIGIKCTKSGGSMPSMPDCWYEVTFDVT